MREIISTDRAPQAIGPYSQAVRAGNLVFASGQIPTDPGTGNFVPGGVAEQTEQVMKNLSAVLEAAGVGFSQVVKTTVFLTDMEDFGAMNEVYGRFFKENPPARASSAITEGCPGRNRRDRRVRTASGSDRITRSSLV